MPDGYAARHLAVELVQAVLRDGRPFDEALNQSYTAQRWRDMEPRDRGLARAIASVTLRRAGQLAGVVRSFLDKPLPADTGALMPILAAAAAQLLILKSPPHAVINIAVEQCRHDKGARRFDRLANAVLRKVASEGAPRLAAAPVESNLPDWLWQRWEAAYGADLARAIADASLREAPLDLTVKSDAVAWAERLGGVVLPTGSIRIARPEGRIEDLPGFADGAWWVQDAAAALPARLLGDVAGQRVLDLCAAPGGKTAQLAAAGAQVTALDVSSKRMGRLSDNLQRLGLTAEVVIADGAVWEPAQPFDAVLLDVPCTSTGTIRRHPDVPHLKRAQDIDRLVDLQARMLAHAARLVRPGGLVVYCCCSLEPEEGPLQISRGLTAGFGFERVPVMASEAGLAPELITAEGDIRTLPVHLSTDPPEAGGLDGFFIARLRRTG